MFPVTSFLFGFIFKIVKGMISRFPYFTSINRAQSSRILILNALHLQWSELPTRGQCSVYLKQNRQKKEKLQRPTNSINSEWLKCLSFSTFNSNFFLSFTESRDWRAHQDLWWTDRQTGNRIGRLSSNSVALNCTLFSSRFFSQQHVL